MIIKAGNEVFREQTKDTLIIHKEVLTQDDKIYGILKFDTFQTHNGQTWNKLTLDCYGAIYGEDYYSLISMNDLFNNLSKQLELELK